MKRKAALFDPYLDVMGGGERHILSIMKVLQKEGYDLDIFWPEDMTRQIQERLHLSFDPSIQFIPNWKQMSPITRFQKLGSYDIALYVTDGSYFFSSAKKNIVFCMVPKKSMYNMSPINVLKTLNYTFISNSKYTHRWLSQWGIVSNILYPFVDDVFMNIRTTDKKPIILTVGRFFKHLHSKRQDIAIEWFKVLKKEYPQFADYSLVLAGSVKPEDEEYVQDLKARAEHHTDIQFKTNIAFNELTELYKEASFYWHFAGFEIDESVHPEKVEHLGITPLEAMAASCITCAYQAGGPKEIIHNGKTGILFKDQQKLFDAMVDIMSNESSKIAMRTEAKEFVRTHFSYEVFEKTVKKLLID